jgi:primosomal replication protein N
LSQPANKVEISGLITELKPLRHTPAGVPVVEFRLRHDSERAEAGARRKVEAEIEAVAFEAQARLLAGTALGRSLKAEGFLCAKSRRSKRPVLHVTNIEFVEGH